MASGGSVKNECNLPSELLALSKANNYLAINVHRLLAEERENVFFSPVSISTVMAMLICAAEGETEAELMKALGYDHAGIQKNDLASIFQQQMSSVPKNQESYTLACANSMLTQKGFCIKEKYKSVISNAFKALLLEVDFQNDTENAVDEINKWVKENTMNMISKLVEELSPLTVLVLLNAVYFKGKWMHQFDKSKTSPEAFYNKGIENNAKKVDMMHLKRRVLYTENESFQAIQLPYLGETIAMLVLLPIERNGLESIEASFTPSFLNDLKNEMVKRNVEVSLPRFHLEYSKSLLPTFKSLGVEKVFNKGAELGGASDSGELFVSKIIHKAVLEVNEEGSEAAAATMVAMTRRCLSYDPVFIADHPFAFIIFDARSDLILFMGRVEEL